MNEQTATIIATGIIVFAVILSIAGVIAIYYVSRMGQQSTWESQRLSNRRPGPASSVPGGMLWMGVELKDRLQDEMRGLEIAGYRSQLIQLPDGHSYCVRVSGVLPRKERTAYLYLACNEHFPLTPPEIYAEVLSATRFDEYGQTETREVALQPLATIMGWDMQSASLLSVTREAFIQLDESYRPTGQLSGFLNEYGDWVRPS